MGVEIDIQCDRCGCEVSDDGYTVLCDVCAPDGVEELFACDPIPIRGTYTCVRTQSDFVWDGDLPPFCPMCGGRIGKR